MGLGVGGGVVESFLLFYSVALGGHQIHVCCSNFIREVDFSIPAKVRVVVRSVQCIVFVMWDSAQCYSVVCFEMILFTFTEFISRD